MREKKYIFIGWDSDYDHEMIRILERSYEIKVIIMPWFLILLYKLLNKTFGRKSSKIITLIFLKVRLLFENKNSTLILKEQDYFNYHYAIKNSSLNKKLIVRNILSDQDANRFKNIFSDIYTFDYEQASRFDFYHYNQFFTGELIVESIDFSKRTQSDSVYFLGRNKGREPKIATFSLVLNNLGFTSDFNIVNDGDKLISYKESVIKSVNSLGLLEVNLDEQVGLTLRSVESLFFNVKLVTNNVSIVNEPFYCKSRVFIVYDFDCIDEVELLDFLNTPILKLPTNILDQYRVSKVFERILT